MKILLSIKPEYAEKILSGEKKYEFRRTLYKNPNVRKVIIYASSPIKKIVGEFEVDGVISTVAEELWHKTKKHSGIDKVFFDSYFEGKKIAHAIKVKKAVRYEEHKQLSDYDIRFAPQSFVYLS